MGESAQLRARSSDIRFGLLGASPNLESSRRTAYIVGVIEPGAWEGINRTARYSCGLSALCQGEDFP
jgi:hypothetical protein